MVPPPSWPALLDWRSSDGPVVSRQITPGVVVMRKRKADWRYQGNVLDPVPGTEHLEELTILDRGLLSREQRKPFHGPICHCRPKLPNRVGGCDPALVIESDQIRPICRTCCKRLDPTEHRRRDQQHVIGLSRLSLDHLDLEDLESMGLLMDSPLKPGEIPQGGLR